MSRLDPTPRTTIRLEGMIELPRNIEIKAKLSDVRTTRQIAEKITDQPVCIITQRDTFFVTRSGRLKLRDFSNGTGELIYYLREDSPDPTGSIYQITRTDDPDGLRDVLGKSLGIIGEVRKIRHLYMCGRTRVHIDNVEDLGDFLELEVVLSKGENHSAGIEEANSLLSKLMIQNEQLVRYAYIDLLTGIA